MSDALNYASPYTCPTRLSKLSIATRAIALLGLPTLIATGYAMAQVNPSSNAIWILILMFAGLPVAGVMTAIVALSHITTSQGALRGKLLSTFAIAASIIWPIGFLCWLIPNLPNC